jgi:hypothetical protein
LCALGRDPAPALARSRSQPVAVRLVLQRGHGIARVAPEVDALRAGPEVIALDLTVHNGEPTSVHVDDFALLGRCAVRADSAAQAAAFAERLARRVSDAIAIEQGAAADGLLL